MNIKISLSVDNMALKLEVMEFLLSVHFKQCVLCALPYLGCHTKRVGRFFLRLNLRMSQEESDMNCAKKQFLSKG